MRWIYLPDVLHKKRAWCHQKFSEKLIRLKNFNSFLIYVYIFKASDLLDNKNKETGIYVSAMWTY